MCEQNEHQDTNSNQESWWKCISTMIQVKCSAQSEVGLSVGDVWCMVVILLEYFFHQPYFPVFYLKPFSLLFVQFLYTIKLSAATNNILHVQIMAVIRWVHDSIE